MAGKITRTARPGRIAGALESGERPAPPFVVYDEGFCSTLVKQYSLACNVGDLSAALIAAGNAYVNAGPFGHVLDDSHIPEPSENLQTIRGTAETLSLALLVADATTLHGLYEQSVAEGVRMGDTLASDERWHPASNDYRAKVYLRRLLHVLATVAKDNYPTALAARRKPRRGRPSNNGLDVFVRRLARFWAKTQKRKFTVDYTSEKSGKGAVRFIIDAMRALDDVPDSLMVSVSRKIRKELDADNKSPRKA